MQYRSLGSFGIKVSEIGFGAWGIGGWTPGQLSYGATDDSASLAALERAFDLGITLIDTAHLYGLGHSESLIGKAIRGRRDRVVLATKAGYVDYATQPDYSPAAIERSLHVSLKRLGTDAVDLLQLHSPPAEILLQYPEIFDSLARLRKRGLTRALGFSAASPADAAAVLRQFPFDSVQVNLNMLDIRALQCGLIEAARAAGAGIVARTPLAFGFLSGTIAPDTVFPAEDHRSRWPGSQIARWTENAAALLALADAGRGQTAAQTALRFCLSIPEVSAVIPGITTVDEASENAAASELGPLRPEIIQAIVDYHARNDLAPGQSADIMQTRG
jgi:aryl-alcohol dehydrogenase-like predicted oxidoreductase